MRHGLRASTLPLDGTLDADAASIIAELSVEHTPQDIADQLKLEKLASVILRLRRQARLEQEALDHQHAFQAEGTGRLIQFIALTDKELANALEDWNQVLNAARPASEEPEDQTESPG